MSTLTVDHSSLMPLNIPFLFSLNDSSSVLNNLSSFELVVENKNKIIDDYQIMLPIFYCNNDIIFDLNDIILKKENIKKIEQMKSFDDNWNGYGAKKFTSEAIAHFKEIIQNLDVQPDIAPTGRNSLFMQYELDNDILTFEVSADKTEKVYVQNDDYDHAKVEQFYTNVISKIKDSVKNFYEQR